MTAQEKFLARFRHKKEHGLIDIKFYVEVSGKDDVTVEDFFAAANGFFAAVDRGDCFRHSTWTESFQKRDLRTLLGAIA